jgi:uncharacterized membrane protein YdjX (TVP38/TMEM64 family)
VVALIDGGGSGDRTVASIECDLADDELILDAALVDPQGPEAPGQVVEQFFDDDVPRASRHPWIKATVALAALLALAAAWKWTPLADWVQPEHVVSLAARLREHPLAPLVVLSAYVVGSLLMVPLTALLMATALTFGFWQSTGYSLLGASLGGVAGFGLGHWLGRDALQRVAGSRLRRVSESVGRRGLLSVLAIRLVPVAPFTLANMIIGASHVRLRDFTLGSAIALLPGVVAINLFETNLQVAITQPTWGTILLVVAIPITAVLLLALLRRAVRNLSHDDE